MQYDVLITTKSFGNKILRVDVQTVDKELGSVSNHT